MSDSHSKHSTHQMIEAGMGAAAEVAKQAGLLQTAARHNAYHIATHHNAGKAGAMVVQGVMAAAPVVAAGVVAAAPVVIAASVVSGVAYVGYQLWQWLDS